MDSSSVPGGNFEIMNYWAEKVINYKETLEALRGSLDATNEIRDQWEVMHSVKETIKSNSPRFQDDELLTDNSNFSMIVIKPFIFRHLLLLCDFLRENVDSDIISNEIGRIFNGYNYSRIPWAHMIWHLLLYHDGELISPIPSLRSLPTSRVFYKALAYIAGLFRCTPLNPCDVRDLLISWIMDIYYTKDYLALLEERGDEDEAKVVKARLVSAYITVPDQRFDRALTLMINYFANRRYHYGQAEFLRKVLDARKDERQQSGIEKKLPREIMYLIANVHSNSGKEEEEAFNEMGLKELWLDLKRGTYIGHYLEAIGHFLEE